MSTPAQNINPSRARLWLPLDGQWVTGGIQVGRNLGSAPGAPAYVRMGDGTTVATFPAQRANSRGVRFDGGDYMRIPLDFASDEPFTIAALCDTSSGAGYFAATYDSVPNVGMYFGITANRALTVAVVDVTAGSISLVTADGVIPAQRSTRLFCLTYDGGMVPGSLSVSMDDVVIPGVGGGVSISGSISSGRDMLIGGYWGGAVPSTLFSACSMYCVAVYDTVLDAYERRLLKARMMQEIHVP